MANKQPSKTLLLDEYATDIGVPKYNVLLKALQEANEFLDDLTNGDSFATYQRADVLRLAIKKLVAKANPAAKR